MKELSIIIINYNTFRLTSNCLKSIYEFAEEINFEIILVDNASTECDPERFLDVFPSVKLVKNESNIGFSKGNNLGLRNANGKYFLLLNSDTEFVDNSLKKALVRLQNEPEVGAISGRLLFPSGQHQPSCGRLPSLKLQLIELLRLQKLLPKRISGRLLLGNFFNYTHEVYPDWVWGTFFLFKPQLLEYFPNNQLPETYFMYCEDYEWGYLIKKSPFKILFDPEIKILHFIGGSPSQTKSDILIERNYRDFVIRSYGKFYYYIFFFIYGINKRLAKKHLKHIKSSNI